METIRHLDAGVPVVVAKLLTGYAKVTEKIEDSEAFVAVHQTFDASFVAHVTAWQSNHDLTPDGVIGPKTWARIKALAPTCSTSKNRISGATLALQLLLNTNITCDAIYGPRTKAAVVVFQTSTGLYADGVTGPKTWGKLIDVASAVAQATSKPAEAAAEVPDVTGKGFSRPVDYKQGDSRWGSKMYSNHNDKGQTMANSGCGPTAMADIVATVRDSSKTPYDLAKLAMEWGDRTYSSGTAWAFMIPHIMDHFGFARAIQTASWDALAACLDAGGYAVCSMGPGYWTSGGHFICAWKYDATYVYCNDPASSKRTKQIIKEFMAQRKQFFCFYPEKKAGTTSATPVVSGYHGNKIVDFSKWQPTVDYDKLLGDAALAILRAGYRGTLGSVKMDECFKQHAQALRARGVRFGVYFYSIADTRAKAVEEARKFVDYATEYNPLFWAIDAEKPEITTAALYEFANELRRLDAQRIGAYIANELYEDPYHFDDVRDEYDFTWIPKYLPEPPKWKCDLWQHTSRGTIDGIKDYVDLNTITGDGHSLAWFLGGDD